MGTLYIKMSNYQFFKFRSINKHFIESLFKGSIFFASPKRLNDPFDCNIDIKKSIETAAVSLDEDKAIKLRELLKNEELFKQLQTDINNLGICSFSLELKEILLWSHYANDHKGLCILYEFPEDFLTDDKNKIFGAAGVSYEPESLTKWFTSIADSLPIDFEKFVFELAQTIVTAKSPCWSYEKEVRIIRSQCGPFKIPKSFIKQICFGLQTSEEDVELVQEVIRHYTNKVNFCRVIRGESDFGIDVVDI